MESEHLPLQPSGARQAGTKEKRLEGADTLRMLDSVSQIHITSTPELRGQSFLEGESFVT